MTTSRTIKATANAYLEAVSREALRRQYRIKYRGSYVDHITRVEDNKYVVYLTYLNEEEIRTEGMTVRGLIELMGYFSVVIE